MTLNCLKRFNVVPSVYHQGSNSYHTIKDCSVSTSPLMNVEDKHCFTLSLVNLVVIYVIHTSLTLMCVCQVTVLIFDMKGVMKGEKAVFNKSYRFMECATICNCIKQSVNMFKNTLDKFHSNANIFVLLFCFCLFLCIFLLISFCILLYIFLCL